MRPTAKIDHRCKDSQGCDFYMRNGLVMPALVAGIHVFTACVKPKTWMVGTSPAVTMGGARMGL
jgi:hypothetical protein